MDDRELPEAGTVYRTMGLASPWSRIGCGIMDKAGISNDHREYAAPTWSMILVLRGAGSYTDHQLRSFPLGPGSCFVRVPARRHSTVLDSTSRWLEAFIDCGPELARTLLGMQALRADPASWNWGLTRERVARFTTLRDDLARAGEAQLPALLLRVLTLAVEAQPQVEAAQDDAISRACAMLSEQSGQRQDLRSWCRRQGLDYERFRKAFLRRTGTSPGQYRIRRRLERACALLQSTRRSLASIAAELGYCSPYEFSNQFRARMGVPPSRYRAR